MEENNVKSEEQIREEVKAEIQKEEQIKADVKKEMEDQQDNAKKTSKKAIKLIWNIVITLVFIFVAFEAIMGVLNMQRLNEDKEPVWYIDTKIESKDGVKETKYNMGLYVIVKTESNKEKKINLKPFFIN